MPFMHGLIEKYSNEVDLLFLKLAGLQGLFDFPIKGCTFLFVFFLSFYIQIWSYIYIAIYTLINMKGDLIQYIDASAGMVPTFSVTTKCFIMIWYVKEINALWPVLKIDFLNSCKTEKHRKMMRKSILFANGFIILFMNLTYGNLLFWLVRPFAYEPNIFNSINGTETVYKVVDSLYPFEWRENPMYSIIMFYEIFGVSAVVSFMMSIDLIPCVFITLICGHIDVLMSALEELIHEAELTGVSNGSGKSFGNPCSDKELEQLEVSTNSQEALYDRLKLIIKDHQRLLIMFDKIKTVFNPIMTVHLGLVCTSVCIMIFKVTKGEYESATQTMRDYHYIATFTTQMFIFPWFGSEIKYKSTDLNWIIYRSDWVRASRKFQKASSFMMLQVQEPLKLRMIDVMDVDLAAFEFACRLCYSYYTLLSNVY